MSVSRLHYKPNFTQFTLLLIILQSVLIYYLLSEMHTVLCISATMFILPHITLYTSLFSAYSEHLAFDVMDQLNILHKHALTQEVANRDLIFT